MIEDRFTDPLLLCGEEGVGRRFSALEAVKEVFCQRGRKSGCECPGCLQVREGCHPDLTVILAGADKIKVDTIREAIDLSWIAPTVAPRRFIVIDGADRMTPEAANALLKTLEEPPPLARFLLLCESYHRVIPTIRSRCGKISYRPLADDLVLSVLPQGARGDGKASIYARMGEGSVGRSATYLGTGKLSLRDQVFSLVQSALDRDIAGVFSKIDTIGADLPLALRFIDHLLHDILMAPYDANRMINLDRKEDVLKLSSGAGLLAWVKLGEGARSVWEVYRDTRINLAFHVKALFADTFCAG
jgi:DNA polymerase-3 subunit delta'